MWFVDQSIRVLKTCEQNRTLNDPLNTFEPRWLLIDHVFLSCGVAACISARADESSATL